MHHAKSDSEVTSLAPSSPPRSPRRPVYYVMSPSHHDPAEKMSLGSSPPGSPLYHHPHHQRYASSPLHHHSRESSGTRFSASLVVKPLHGQAGAWRKLHQMTGGRVPGGSGGEGDDDEDDVESGFGSGAGGVDPRCYVVWFCLGFVVLFSLFSLILWASSQAYPPRVVVKSIVFESLDLQAGMDWTGVPTKMVSLNSTVHISFRNPATFFGVHVSSTPLELYYYQLKLASGTVREFYQSRKSARKLLVRLGGLRVPLYGGGPGITSRTDGGPPANFPLEIVFSVRARAYVLGRLVKPTFHTTVRCSLRFREAGGIGRPIDMADRCTYREH